MWIGVDDTDSVRGGCTTYLARLILEKLTDQGFGVIGYPRLVRLNPNIPWKTRGNGAIAMQIGRGRGSQVPIAEVQGRVVQASLSLQSDLEYDDYKVAHALVDELVNAHAFFDDKKTNPGVVVLPRQPDPRWYQEAVTGVVSLDRVRRELLMSGALFTPYKNGRGLIGATAAIAWVLGDSTYEVICYRERSRWGTPRSMDEASVMAMDQAFPSTFDNYDYRHRSPRIAPHSPCPILFGIRGRAPLTCWRRGSGWFLRRWRAGCCSIRIRGRMIISCGSQSGSWGRMSRWRSVGGSRSRRAASTVVMWCSRWRMRPGASRVLRMNRRRSSGPWCGSCGVVMRSWCTEGCGMSRGR